MALSSGILNTQFNAVEIIECLCGLMLTLLFAELYGARSQFCSRNANACRFFPSITITYTTCFSFKKLTAFMGLSFLIEVDLILLRHQIEIGSFGLKKELS